MKQQTNVEIYFADWVFDPQTGQLSSAERTETLEPQIAKLLSFLYFNQGQVLTRQTILNEVWKDRVVSDHALNRCLSILRQILSREDGETWIKTLPRRGIIAHFPAPTAATNHSAIKQDTQKGKQGRPFYKNKWIALFGLVIIFILLLSQPYNNNESQNDISVSSRLASENLVAYRVFKKALNKINSRELSKTSEQYYQLLQKAIDLDPNFDEAWAELVAYHSFRSFRVPQSEEVAKAEKALEKLKVIAPDSEHFYYASASYLYYVIEDYHEALTAIDIALEIQPDDPRYLQTRFQLARRLNNHELVLTTLQNLMKIETNDSKWADAYFSRLLSIGRYEKLEKDLEQYQYSRSATLKAISSIIKYRRHRDIETLARDIGQSCEFSTKPDCAWQVNLAYGNINGATSALAEVELVSDTTGLTLLARQKMMTEWLVKESPELSDSIENWKSALSLYINDIYSPDPTRIILVKAIIAGAEKSNNTARTMVHSLFNQTPIDWAARYLFRGEGCRILGMIGEAEEAVECLRVGFAEGSYMISFLETELPFYDSIRSTQVFIEFENSLKIN